MPSKKMHYEEEFINDLKDFNVDKWFHDRYSTSKHLWVLYSLICGLNAKHVGEIGFGRSTITILYTLGLTGGKLVCCDRFDYRDMIPSSYRGRYTYIHGDSGKFYKHPKVKGLDFLFLDYMSSRKKSVESCYKDLKKAIKLMKTNGIIAVHDTNEKKYNVGAAFEMIKKKKGLEVLTLPYNYGLGLIRNRRESKYGKIKDTWQKK